MAIAHGRFPSPVSADNECSASFKREVNTVRSGRAPSSAPILLHTDCSTVREGRSKKRVRFSSPIDDSTPPANTIDGHEDYDAVMRCLLTTPSPLPRCEPDKSNIDNIVQQAARARHCIKGSSNLDSDSESEDGDQSPTRAACITQITTPAVSSCCFKCYESTCVCSVCPRCDQPINHSHRVLCNCYCKDCTRPIAAALGVQSESAPPGYYCRCRTDPDVKKYYDEICGREEVFTRANYDEVERMMREFLEEQQQVNQSKGETIESEVCAVDDGNDGEEGAPQRKKRETPGEGSAVSSAFQNGQRTESEKTKAKSTLAGAGVIWVDLTDDDIESCSNGSDSDSADEVDEDSSNTYSVSNHFCADCSLHVRDCRCEATSRPPLAPSSNNIKLPSTPEKVARAQLEELDHADDHKGCEESPSVDSLASSQASGRRQRSRKSKPTHQRERARNRGSHNMRCKQRKRSQLKLQDTEASS